MWEPLQPHSHTPLLQQSWQVEPRRAALKVSIVPRLRQTLPQPPWSDTCLHLRHCAELGRLPSLSQTAGLLQGMPLCLVYLPHAGVVRNCAAEELPQQQEKAQLQEPGGTSKMPLASAQPSHSSGPGSTQSAVSSDKFPQVTPEV